MRFRVNKNRRGGTVYEYAQIIEDFVENGKKNTRVLKHLGRIGSQEDLDRYRKLFALEVKKAELQKVDMRTLRVMTPLDYGMIYAASVISRPIDPVLSMLGVHRDIIFLGMISRLIRPGSDLSLIRFLDTVYYPRIADLKKDSVYEALDALLAVKDDLEIAIVKALKPDLRRVYYDLTSTYFEGREKNDLVVFGYSRDKKRGKEQIVIALVMADGIPIHHEVFPGNTVDPSTLKKMLHDLRERFHVGRVVFIADRAFGRRPSLSFLDRNEYVTALYRWDRPYREILMEQAFSEGDRIGDLGIYAREVHVDWNLATATTREKHRAAKRRAITVWNPDRAESDREDLDEKISAVSSMLRSHGGKDLNEKLGSLRKYVRNGRLNESRISMERKLAGRYMIVTDTDLPVEDTIRAYKDLWRIERSFRTMKSFIEIRPVNHRRPDRIRAHVFLCVLSFLLSRMIEKTMDDKMTISAISDRLSELMAIPVKVEEGIVTLTSDSENARKTMEAMKIPYPGRVLESVPT